VVKGKLVPVKSATGLLDRPADLWSRAFAVAPELGQAACGPRDRYDAPSVLGEALPEVTAELWPILYSAGGTPVPVELLVPIVRDTLVDLFGGLGGMFVGLREKIWRHDLDSVLAALAMAGAVELTTSTDPAEQAKIAEMSGTEKPSPVLARLTPLGLWGTRAVLLAAGYDAPTVAELAGWPLAVVCAAVEHSAAELVQVVMAAWAAARDADAAAAEVMELVVGAPSASVRLLALSGLAHTGAAGVEQAHRLRSAGGVAGAVATGWLVEHGALPPDGATEQELVLALAEELAAVHDHDLLIEELTGSPVAEQLVAVCGLADAEHPERSAMLTTIADRHPEPEVAAVARTALIRS
jgi:hypothetical protein